MKKLLKLAAVFAAFALMFGFASCSDSDDDDDEPTSPPPGTTYSVSLYIPNLETGKYGAAETYNIGTRSSISATELGAKLKQDKATILNSFIEMVNKEDGTQYTIDDVELRFCSEKPAEESEPEWLTTISAGTAVYVVPEVTDENVGRLDYTFDFASIFATAPDGITYEANKLPGADAKISTGKTAVSVDSDKVSIYSLGMDNEGVNVDATKGGLRLRKDTYQINYNGTNANATDWAVDGTAKGDDGKDFDRYVGVNVNKLGATSGNIEVEFGFKVNTAKPTDTLTNAENGAVALVDKDSKILAVKNALNFTSAGGGEFTIKATVPATTEEVKLVLSRGGAKKGNNGTGGIDVTSITAKTAN